MSARSAKKSKTWAGLSAHRQNETLRAFEFEHVTRTLFDGDLVGDETSREAARLAIAALRVAAKTKRAGRA